MPAIPDPNMSIHNRSHENGQAGIDGEILASAAQGLIRPLLEPERLRIASLRRLFHLVFPIGRLRPIRISRASDVRLTSNRPAMTAQT
jgi:hypothetical protein